MMCSGWGLPLRLQGGHVGGNVHVKFNIELYLMILNNITSNGFSQGLRMQGGHVGGNLHVDLM